MTYRCFFVAVLAAVLASCSGSQAPEPEPQPSGLYFPPSGSSEWQTVTPAALGWDQTPLPALQQLLEQNNTRAFLLLKDGRIVLEYYMGKEIIGTAPFKASSVWYWASAGKTLTGFTVGRAQQDGFLSLQHATSRYLGQGWSSLTPEQEGRIAIAHQLSMTSGLDDGVADNHSFAKADLRYKTDPGMRWAYHNAPYTLLEQVVAKAVGKDFGQYFNQVLRDKIGMDGLWRWSGNDHVYYSTPRAMARFGLLMLAGGQWQGQQLIDPAFLAQSTASSQSLNPSYGYLWWLNGKTSYQLPGIQVSFPGPLLPSAPPDTYNAVGKNGQYICVVPSKGLVLVRMGEAPVGDLVPTQLLEEIWQLLGKVVR